MVGPSALDERVRGVVSQVKEAYKTADLEILVDAARKLAEAYLASNQPLGTFCDKFKRSGETTLHGFPWVVYDNTLNKDGSVRRGIGFEVAPLFSDSNLPERKMNKYQLYVAKITQEGNDVYVSDILPDGSRKALLVPLPSEDLRGPERPRTTIISDIPGEHKPTGSND